MIMETLVSAARGIVNVLAKLKQAFVDSTTMLNNTDTKEVHKKNKDKHLQTCPWLCFIGKETLLVTRALVLCIVATNIII